MPTEAFNQAQTPHIRNLVSDYTKKANLILQNINAIIDEETITQKGIESIEVELAYLESHLRSVTEELLPYSQNTPSGGVHIHLLNNGPTSFLGIMRDTGLTNIQVQKGLALLEFYKKVYLKDGLWYLTDTPSEPN